jgi:hypothetical protein
LKSIIATEAESLGSKRFCLVTTLQEDMMPDFSEFETLEAAKSASIGPDVKFLRTAGYAAIGDGGGALSTAQPATPANTSLLWPLY